jgi:hypothetical protein
MDVSSEEGESGIPFRRPDRQFEAWERQEIRQYWPSLKKISNNYKFASQATRALIYISGVIVAIAASHTLITKVALAILGGP